MSFRILQSLVTLTVAALPCLAAQLDITPPAPVTVVEGGTVQLTFNVTNNTKNTLVLDYAFAAVNPGGPDPTDFVNFSGANGNAGLVSAPLYLLAGAMGAFTYSFTSPADVDADVPDFGRDPVSFSLEMAPYFGALASLPNPNRITSFPGYAYFVDLSGLGFPYNQTVLNELRNFQNPCTITPNCDPTNPPLSALLYPNGILGLATNTGTSPALSAVTVDDVGFALAPEPASFTLTALALAALGATILYASGHKRT